MEKHGTMGWNGRELTYGRLMMMYLDELTKKENRAREFLEVVGIMQARHGSVCGDSHKAKATKPNHDHSHIALLRHDSAWPDRTSPRPLHSRTL